MARAIDVARYILEQRDAREHMTTAFALQKLLYYCQAWTLVATDRSLFDDRIEAWRHGPVVHAVYPYCRGRHYVFPREIPEGDASALNVQERLIVDRVLSMFERQDDTQLGDALESMSHEERPWSSVASGTNGVISQESMLDFYSALQADPSLSHAAPIPNLADVSDRTFISGEDADMIAALLSDQA